MDELKLDECVELKNIKYKTMLLSGIPIKETLTSNDILSLERFLEDEKNTNINGPWCKLDKTLKSKKLLSYVESYAMINNFETDETELMIIFLKECLERKKFQRVKDIIYDKVTGQIKEIPSLVYNKQTKHFTLKHSDKRVSTLKGLPPKKINGTVRNKHIVSTCPI